MIFGAKIQISAATKMIADQANFQTNLKSITRRIHQLRRKQLNIFPCNKNFLDRISAAVLRVFLFLHHVILILCLVIKVVNTSVIIIYPLKASTFHGKETLIGFVDAVSKFVTNSELKIKSPIITVF